MFKKKPGYILSPPNYKRKYSTLVDNFNRESLAIKMAYRLGGHGVVAVLIQAVEEKGLPKSIRIDNGPEFTSKVLNQWAYLNGVELDFIRPGKPTDNVLIESFNGCFREECLNESWFLSLEDAGRKRRSGGNITTWRGLMDRLVTDHHLNSQGYWCQNS